jgi:histidine triad (HIT) family protein
MVDGTVPFEKIYEDETHLSFLTIFPNTEGLTVVIPKDHHDSAAFQQSDEILKDLIIASKKTANILTNYYEDVGRCGMVLEGFGVNHLHAKIYPLHGTNTDKWRELEGEGKKDYFKMYPGYICSNNSELADAQELKKLAQNIRNSSELE